MARSLGRLRPRTLRGRFLFAYGSVLVALIVAGVVLDARLANSLDPAELGPTRIVMGACFVLVALVGLLMVLAWARSVSRPLDEITASVARLGRGRLDTHIPDQGPKEIASLARTLDLMRADLMSRLEASERDRRKLDAILASLDEGVVLFGPDGRALYRNASGHDLLGSDVETIRQLSPSNLQRLVTAARHGPVQEEIVLAGPAARTVLAAAGPVSDDGDVLLVLRDVTEPRRLDAIRRDFVANASHELKTPTASIQALAETISSAAGDDPAAVAKFASQLENEAARMARMVSDLLDLSRLEGERGVRDEVRFDRLVTQEAERHRARAEAAGLQFVVRADRPVRVSGSARDLSLMLRNLVENALEYTRPGGRVEVSVSAPDSEAVLQVRDTGIGIPTRDLTRVFERFYRVDRARSRETGGTGLGLSIVKHVAESLGGSVDVESRLGEGSVFTVRLPLSTTAGTPEAR